ncbi:MAG: putative addiction module antidote protein [Methyloprofundus sp.]|nr:putative addiction module antidote protein [Methyloprofundus sp.]
MAIELKAYNPVEFLQNEEEIVDYLNDAYADDDPSVFLVALGHIAKAKGMVELAKVTGLSQENLYKALSGETQPRWDTVQRVIKALHINLKAVA